MVAFLGNKAEAQQGLKAAVVSASLPIGTVIPYAGAINDESRAVLASAGWLICDGKEISREKYARLYKVIGDIHGRGDAVKTFNLPDYRGRFLRGVNADSGRDPDAAKRDPAAPGGLAGDSVGSVQSDEFRLHTHQTMQMILNNDIDGVDSVTLRSYEHHNETRDTGSAGGNETRPKNAYVNWLILGGQ